MITITSVEIVPNPCSFEPEMHFEGVLRLDDPKMIDITDDDYALMIGREFLKHLVFVVKVTDGDTK